VLTANYGWEPLAAFCIGLGASLSLALIVGYPVVRLKGHYLAMATLAIGLVIYEVAVQWDNVTGGYMGVSGIPRVGIGPWVIGSDRAMLVFIAIVTALSIAAAACISDRGWVGRCRPFRAAKTRHRLLASTSTATSWQLS
ncbi:MAG: branched-chain amino acid ABC transporter permease, partial [Sulfitobacter sp. SK025]